LVSALLAAGGPAFSLDEARDKWDVLLAARYAAIGGAAGSAAAAVLTAGGVAAPSLLAKRVVHALAACLSVLALAALSTAAICWAHLQSKLSAYPYASLQLGYSWTLIVAAGGLLVLAATLLVAHALCLCLCPRACCARGAHASGSDDTDDVELTVRTTSSQRTQKQRLRRASGAGSAASSASAGARVFGEA